MKEYITVTDADAILGEDWATQDKKERAVMLANVWMTNKNLPEVEPIPQEWKKAACEVAKEAAAGTLYRRTEKGVMSKSASAGSVSSSKTFSAEHEIITAGESLAMAMLKPWLPAKGRVFMLKRC